MIIQQYKISYEKWYDKCVTRHFFPTHPPHHINRYWQNKIWLVRLMFDSMQAGDRRNTNSSNTNLGLKPSTQLLLIVQSLPISPLVGEKNIQIYKKKTHWGFFFVHAIASSIRRGWWRWRGLPIPRSENNENWEKVVDLDKLDGDEVVFFLSQTLFLENVILLIICYCCWEGLWDIDLLLVVFLNPIPPC